MRGGRGTKARLPWAVEQVGGKCRGMSVSQDHWSRRDGENQRDVDLKYPGGLFCLKMGETQEYLNADVKEPKEMKRLRCGSERRFWCNNKPWGRGANVYGQSTALETHWKIQDGPWLPQNMDPRQIVLPLSLPLSWPKVVMSFNWRKEAWI